MAEEEVKKSEDSSHQRQRRRSYTISKIAAVPMAGLMSYGTYDIGGKLYAKVIGNEAKTEAVKSDVVRLENTITVKTGEILSAVKEVKDSIEANRKVAETRQETANEKFQKLFIDVGNLKFIVGVDKK